MKNTGFDHILKIKDVMEVLNISRVSVWRLHAQKKLLPPPLMAGNHTLGWRKSVIEEFIQSLEVSAEVKSK